MHSANTGIGICVNSEPWVIPYSLSAVFFDLSLPAHFFSLSLLPENLAGAQERPSMSSLKTRFVFSLLKDEAGLSVLPLALSASISVSISVCVFRYPSIFSYLCQFVSILFMSLFLCSLSIMYVS